MRASLTWKLFACFLGLTLLVLVATLALARWSFERGFLDYVNTLDRERLGRISTELIDIHAARGDSWDGLDEAQFERIIVRHAPRRPIDLSAGETARSTMAAVEPPPGRDPRTPPTALFDAAGRQIVGPVLNSDPDNYVRHPILVDGRLIGELHAVVYRRATAPADTAFSRQQGRRGILIGALAMLLAAAVSWRLSRALLAPIRTSLASVARLSSGDYTRHAAVTAFREGDPDELAILANDLERLRSTLDAGRGSRRRLLADISHELRTPLTILSGEIGAMRDGVRALDEEQLTSLDEEVDRLKRLVDDLHELSLSDVGGLRYEFAPLRVDACVSGAIEALRHRAAEAGINFTLTGDDPVEIRGDAHRLHQLFTNLANNSLAYTDAPGRVCVTIGTQDAKARITFEDTAPGVQPGSHERLFESLYRDGASRSRRRGGAGLGLAICRNIVVAHGGRISASASNLGGLRVDIHLPLERTGPHATALHTGRRGRDEDRDPGARLPAT